MSEFFVAPESVLLQSLLFDDTLWQLHRCRLLTTYIGFDEPLSLLAHYDSLDDDIKQHYPLTTTQLIKLNQQMTICQVATYLGIDKKHFKKAWQIKYTGQAVLVMPIQKLAVRFYFSNTAKTSQNVYAANLKSALAQQSRQWRAFGVIDVAYQGLVPLISQADTLLAIDTPTFSPLPNSHSLGISQAINEQKDTPSALFIALHDNIAQQVMAMDNEQGSYYKR